jgi:S-DNA-T family DNA segregation ATPase FtsK/SpoIIIE
MALKLFKSSEDSQQSVEPEAQSVSRSDWLIKDLVLLSCIGLAFFLFIILYSYSPEDPGFDKAINVESYFNYGGTSGAWLSSLLLYLFGVFGFAWPFGILLAAWVTLKLRMQTEFDWGRLALSLAGLVVLVLSGAGMSSLYLHPDAWVVALPYYAGGVIGYEFSLFLVESVDLLATTLFLLVLFAIGVSMLINQSWLTICEVTGHQAWRLAGFIQRNAKKTAVHSEQFKNVLSRLDLKKETEALPNSQTVKPVVTQKMDVSARIEEKRAKLFQAWWPTLKRLRKRQQMSKSNRVTNLQPICQPTAMRNCRVWTYWTRHRCTKTVILKKT